MNAILNVIWLVLCGLWMAIGYAAAGLICFILIITIPFGIASFRIASYVLWPFGRTIEPRRRATVDRAGPAVIPKELDHRLTDDRQVAGQGGGGGLTTGGQVLKQPPPGRVGHRGQNLVRRARHLGHGPASADSSRVGRGHVW